MSTDDGSSTSDRGEVPRARSQTEVLFRRAGRAFSRKRVREFASRLASELAEGREFTCLLTDDRELRRLNREFLGNDYPTDVLSFSEGETGGGTIETARLGEVAISVERAEDQAAEFGHSVEDEIGILMLHGALHLAGMDHESDRGRMARTERRWRKKLGLPGGLIERTER